MPYGFGYGNIPAEKIITVIIVPLLYPSERDSHSACMVIRTRTRLESDAITWYKYVYVEEI